MYFWYWSARAVHTDQITFIMLWRKICRCFASWSQSKNGVNPMVSSVLGCCLALQSITSGKSVKAVQCIKVLCPHLCQTYSLTLLGFYLRKIQTHQSYQYYWWYLVSYLFPNNCLQRIVWLWCLEHDTSFDISSTSTAELSFVIILYLVICHVCQKYIQNNLLNVQNC